LLKLACVNLLNELNYLGNVDKKLVLEVGVVQNRNNLPVTFCEIVLFQPFW